MSTAIRPFMAEDAPAALELCRALHRESSLSYLPFNAQKVLGLFAQALAMPEETFFWVAVRDGTLVGSMYGNITGYFGCDGRLAAEKWVHALPQHRGAGAATSLVKQFIRWARENRADEVMISPSTGIQTERTARWLEHLGMDRVGVMLKKRL